MTTVAVRLPDGLVQRLDALVAATVFPSRSEALRQALEALLDEAERAAVDRAILDGYRRHPPPEPGVDVRTRALASVEEEAW